MDQLSSTLTPVRDGTSNSLQMHLTIHGLIEEQAARTPDAVALVFHAQKLTYRELNQQANRLALSLRQLGVVPDQPVGIAVDRSAEMVIALLAILKAGGAYLPLDPAYPRDRLAFMLKDSQAPLLLTQRHHRDRFADASTRMVFIDDERPGSTNGGDLPPAATADNLAYVIYTSGSTGIPKGIGVMHRNAVNILYSLQQRPGLTAADVLLATGTFCFDISVPEVFLPLTVGARLVVADSETCGDGWKLSRLIADSRATLVQATPAGWHMLLHAGWQGSPELTVFSAGEALPRELANQLLARSRAVWNLYGPTETTVYSIIEHVEPGDGPVPIGLPVANTQIYFLDEQLKQLPDGATGEICIAGAGVTRGYLNRPELTAERFIANPFDAQGSRLYRTGDLGRRRPDGKIDYLGRLDHQVKIRGFRIELGEIEHTLARHPAVRQCVVTAVGQDNDRRLVAYVVRQTDAGAGPQEWRAFLAGALPDYMIPAVFVEMAALPLTPAGKVDRLALPAPGSQRPSLSQDYTAPGNDLERQLVDTWEQVLGIRPIGIHDNFFELGGHSLQGTELVARLQTLAGVQVGLCDLLARPTVAGLAGTFGMSCGAAPPPVVAAASRGILSFGQLRHWFLDRLQDPTVYIEPLFVKLRGVLDWPKLRATLQQIVQRHEVLRTAYREQDGQPRTAVMDEWTGADRPPVDLAALPAGEREERLQVLLDGEMHRLFDLSQGDVMRVLLLRLQEQEHLLAVTLHHIAYDGWSTNVFLEELAKTYQALVRSLTPALPDLSLQYGDFAVQQRERFTGQVADRLSAFWKKELDGAEYLELASDFPRPTAIDFAGAFAQLELKPSLKQAVDAFARQRRITPFTVCLAALQLLLSRLSGQEDIVLGIPFADRHRDDVSNIGYFLNTLVLRTSLAGNPLFATLLERTRVTIESALAHGEYPFEKLLEDLKPSRNLARTPLFEIFLNFLEAPVLPEQFGGLVPELVLFDNQSSAKFALTLYVVRYPDRMVMKALYQKVLFSSEHMEALLRQYELILEQVVADPDRSLADYSLVLPGEKDLLPDPSATLPDTFHEPVTRQFAACVRQTPDAVALQHGDRSWTYREMDDAATGLARVLRQRGNRPGDVVGVAGPRSFGLIAGALAVFKAGGVLFLIDSNMPRERLRILLDKAGVRRLLAVQGCPWTEQDCPTGSQLLPVDRETGRCLAILKGQVDTAPFAEPQPGDPAYLFFTSGTTGTPRAVLGQHKGLAHFLDWQRHTFQVGPGDRSSQLINLSFDAVLRDIFLPLASGATLCLPEEADENDPERLFAWLAEQRITLLHTVPAKASFWLDSSTNPPQASALRWTFFSGEPLLDTLVRRWRRVVCSTGSIANFYGPTETTMIKCFHVVGSEPEPGVQPLGRPMPETQLLVLGKTGQQCGMGEVGQIAIRTPFSTLGYLHEDQENARRFIANPWRNDPADRLFLTGDRGRYRPDGRLEILGRLDDQVKVRGVRVEPAEVSAVLAKHPGVQTCAVVAFTDPDGQTALAAYVVPVAAVSVTAQELRAFLSQRLLQAMVPASIQFVAGLPVTANGKLDRSKLPRPAATADRQRTCTPPRGPVEGQVVAIWTELLGLPQIGIEDNFFELGGHSLLAARVAARISKEMQVELPVRAFFEAPTPAGLAEIITQRLAGSLDAEELERLLDEVEESPEVPS